MKTKKALSVLIILFASFQFIFGQEKPEPILVDEFSSMPCDSLLSRFEGFFVDLLNNPDSQGYAIISGRYDDLRRKVGYELLLEGAMRIRNIERNRITFVRGAEEDDFRVQLWRVPSDQKNLTSKNPNGISFFLLKVNRSNLLIMLAMIFARQRNLKKFTLNI